MQLLSIPHVGRPLTQDRVISVEFSENLERARTVVSRSNHKITGKWPSWKIRRSAQYDSVHERNAFKLIDAWPSVHSWAEQPCVIRYVSDGEEHRHFPDILVSFADKQELWEIKTDADSRMPDVMRRTEIMTARLPIFGYAYRLVIAEDLARNPRLKNLEYLIKWGSEPVALDDQERLRQLFTHSASIPWGFFQAGEPGFKHRRHVCRLLMDGTLGIDIESQWHPTTAVVWNRAEG